MPISDIALLTEEARKGDIFGIVRLYNITNPAKPEAWAERILSITYPSHPLSQALKAVDERLSGKRVQGTFIFAGGYGTGKSHCLLTLFHLFTPKIDSPCVIATLSEAKGKQSHSHYPELASGPCPSQRHTYFHDSLVGNRP